MANIKYVPHDRSIRRMAVFLSAFFLEGEIHSSRP